MTRLSSYRFTSLSGEKTHYPSHAHAWFISTLQHWKEAVIICLCITCSILISQLAFNPYIEQDVRKVPHYHLTSEDTHWTQFQWNTDVYSSATPTEDEAISTAWDEIIPAYGIVAVDYAWADKHHLPNSMRLPSDPSKGVYIIDAYHQLHCLTIIRKTLMEMASDRPLSKPIEHAKHCFDSLLQYIVCGNSGDTLLYTWGRNETGDGQLRKCIDWSSRREWARERSACYKDSDHPIALYDHFNQCEHVDDGIRLPAFADLRAVYPELTTFPSLADLGAVNLDFVTFPAFSDLGAVRHLLAPLSARSYLIVFRK
ncbi:hypothetical protein MMC25_002001 [Agyrium rufum]|nr:hypothetical protein [Agyrium rufum]